MRSNAKDHRARYTYPYLGQYPDTKLVVMFIGKQQGVVVHPGDNKPLGYFSDTWLEWQFQLFDGEITLKN